MTRWRDRLRDSSGTSHQCSLLFSISHRDCHERRPSRGRHTRVSSGCALLVRTLIVVLSVWKMPITSLVHQGWLWLVLQVCKSNFWFHRWIARMCVLVSVCSTRIPALTQHHPPRCVRVNVYLIRVLEYEYWILAVLGGRKCVCPWWQLKEKR